jgi:tyrocidine synthetase III
MFNENDQNLFLTSSKFIRQREYWVKKLSGTEKKTGLSLKREENPGPQRNRESLEFLIPPSLSKQIIKLGKNSDLSIYFILLAALKTLIFHYSSNEDIIVMSPLYRFKISPDTINNRIFLRDKLAGDMTYKEVLIKVRQTALEAYESQDYPFDKLVDHLQDLKHTASNESFSNVLCSLNSIHDEKVFETLQQEFVFAFEWDGEQIKGNIIYEDTVYETYYIRTLAKHFVNLLEHCIQDTNGIISAVSFLSQEEKKTLLHDFNGTGEDVSNRVTIDQLFQAQVEKSSDKMAVVEGRQDKANVSLTYGALNEKANRLAARLKTKGVMADVIVGIMAERSVEMLVGIFAILKAGGAYLPIDTQHPTARKKFLLQDSGTGILLTQRHLFNQDKDLFDNLSMAMENVLFLDNDADDSSDNCQYQVTHTAADLAYVIYTSGTTGKPKGSLIEHRNVVNLVAGLNRRIYSDYPTSLKVCMISPYVFDASVKQIFGALLMGHELCIVPEAARLDGNALLTFYQKYRIDISDGTPTHIRLLTEVMKETPAYLDIKRFIIGGEVLTKKIVEEFYDLLKGTPPVITNAYGPTECTVDAISYDVTKKEATDGDNIPLGKPLVNQQVYILNKANRLCPIGIGGELFISGLNVGRGYLNNSRLSKHKFVTNPFAQGERMYRTGDLARWLPGGDVEFIGREDEQVKIRGFRVELGEIESILLNHEKIKEAVVVLVSLAADDHEESGNDDLHLCAYTRMIESPDDGDIGKTTPYSQELRNYLLKYLPDYAVPNYFIQVPSIPLTANGKVDRRALPKPKPQITGTFTAPANNLERKIALIWSRVLKIDPIDIGRESNFFQLGGHSLKATILAAKIHREFRIRMPLTEIFKLSTIKMLAGHISKQKETHFTPLEAGEDKEYYPLSPAQKRLYILWQLDQSSMQYNMPVIMTAEGPMVRSKLEYIFKQIIERHEILRTSFLIIGDEPMQRIHSTVNLELEYHDLFRIRKETGSKSPIDKIQSEFLQPFDLFNAPLLRLGLIKVEVERFILMIDMHHIVSDGISQRLLLEELMELYSGKELPVLNIQYKDYALWQNNRAAMGLLKEQEEFWLKEIAGEIPVLELPTDFPRPMSRDFTGSVFPFELDREKTEALEKIAMDEGATLYMVLIAVYTILLSRLSNQEDIIIGTPVGGRGHADLEHVVGMLVNTLALRNYTNPEKTLKAFISEVSDRTLEAFENQDYPFEDLVEKAAVNRDIRRNPVFDVMFSFFNNSREGGIDSLQIPGLKLSTRDYDHHMSKFDLTLNGLKIDHQLHFVFEYRTNLFKQETIARLAGYFKSLLSLIIKNSNTKICQIELTTPQEKQRILYEFNDTDADYQKDKTIYECFEAQVERTPEKIAVSGTAKNTGKHHTLTYGELNQKANQFARHLREKGVRADTIVGIMIKRSVEMIIGIFGILKSGGAYLPIDSNYPGERISYILRDSHTGLLLSHNRLLNKIEGECQVIDPGKDEFRFNDISNLGKVNTAKNLSYVIYTSGSTGKPKGVAIEHRSVINRLNWMQKAYPISIGDVILQKTPVVFDVSVWELFWWSFQGSSLYLLGHGEEKNPDAIIAALENHHISVMHFVPSMFHYFLTYLEANPGSCQAESLKHLFCSGEALLPQHVKLFNRVFADNKKTRLINLYGPTEATVDVSYYNCLKELNIDRIPIGKPIDNIKLFVVSAGLNLQPPGIAGELCISGAGTARGYLNNIELTGKKFIANPFPVGGDRLYRTGDSCRWLEDGNIEFLGRIDRQVKIRGFRIELGEIESLLLKHNRIDEAVVVTRGDNLCAYIVPGEGQRISTTDLTVFLSNELPDYMIPGYFVFLERMPLTINGKIDYKALPAPDTGDESALPQNETQKKLAAIWAEVLGIEKSTIGIDANFFKMGGHSLKAIMLTTRIHKAFNTKIPLVDIFKHPTIGKLAIYLKESVESPFTSIPVMENKEYYPLSSAQKRLYILQQMNVACTAYNIPFMAQLIGQFDKQRFREAFVQLIKRHENFRTSFEVIDGEYAQRIHDDIEFEVSYYRYTQDEARDMIENFIRPFHLSNAPLFRVGIIETGENRRLLLVDMHHIISDGLSYDIYKRDLTGLYEGKALPEMRLQYKDFSEWQNHLIKSGALEKQEKYWLDRFKGEIPLLDLPTDYTRPTVHRFEGDVITDEITSHLTGKVKKLALESNVTLYILLLAVYSILLSKYTARADITIGSDNAGRMHPDLDNIIGFFANMLPLRNFPEDHKIFTDYLQEVRQNSLLAYDNQEYQFEELVSQLRLEREAGRHPLVDTVFSIQNLPDGEIAMESGTPAKDNSNKTDDRSDNSYGYENKVAHFDLLVIIHDLGDTIKITWEYATTLFKRSTIEKISKRYLEILEQVIENRHIALKNIEITHDFIGVNVNRFQQEFDNWDF